MGTTGIRGGQIQDETVDSADLASGSVKAGEMSAQVVSGQTTITSVDTSNDYLLIFDATDSALKKVAPTNLGVGGSGSPGGSDTQVQYNNGGSFGGASALVYDDSNNRVGIGGSPSQVLSVFGDVSGDFVTIIDNDENSEGHVMKLTTDGTGNGSYVLDMESSSDTIFRARADGRFGFGTAGVSSMGAGTFVVGISGGHTSDIAISKRMQHLGDGDTYMQFPDPDQLQFVVGGVDILHVTEDDSQDMIVFNEGNADVDFRVESVTKTHAIFVNSGADQVIFHSSSAVASDVSFYVSGSTGATTGNSLFGGDLVVSGGINCVGNLYVEDSAGMYVDKIRRYSGQDNTTKILLNNDHIKLYAGHSSNNIVGIGDNAADDINFRVSGSIGSRTTSTRGTAVFEGDLVVSGGLAVDGSTLVIDEVNSLVGIGTSSPDAILHIDNGTSNTEVIIEKDAGTSGSIVFHNAGSREAHIAFSTNEDIEITNWAADKDIIFAAYDDSGDALTEVMRIDGSEARVGIGTASPSALLDVDGTANATTLSIGGTSITSTAAELNLLDASTTSEASDGAWVLTERIAKVTIDSNDWDRSDTPTDLGVTIPDNAIITKIIFDTSQAFTPSDDGTDLGGMWISLVDIGLYDGSTQSLAFATQASIVTNIASGVPWSVGQSIYIPPMAVPGDHGVKLTKDLNVKIHVWEEIPEPPAPMPDVEGSSLATGVMDMYIYYIIGA